MLSLLTLSVAKAGLINDKESNPAATVEAVATVFLLFPKLLAHSLATTKHPRARLKITLKFLFIFAQNGFRKITRGGVFKGVILVNMDIYPRFPINFRLYRLKME